MWWWCLWCGGVCGVLLCGSVVVVFVVWWCVCGGICGVCGVLLCGSVVWLIFRISSHTYGALLPPILPLLFLFFAFKLSKLCCLNSSTRALLEGVWSALYKCFD